MSHIKNSLPAKCAVGLDPNPGFCDQDQGKCSGHFELKLFRSMLHPRKRLLHRAENVGDYGTYVTMIPKKLRTMKRLQPNAASNDIHRGRMRL